MNKINTDVNYKTMAGNARLVMLGESNHNTAGYKYEAIKAIKQLKAAGFTHFAIEMLPQSMKEQVAFYQRTGKGFEVIQRYFNDNWAWGYLVPHGWHAVEAASYQEGIDTLIQKQGIHNVVFVDFIGGMLCLTEKDCREGSAEDTPLKQQYFYREGFPYKSAIKSFQVHIPEKRVNLDGELQW